MKKYLIILFSILIVSCTTISNETIKKLKPGMSKVQALEIIGCEETAIYYDNYGENNTIERYKFVYHQKPLHLHRHILEVHFINDKLKSFSTY